MPPKRKQSDSEEDSKKPNLSVSSSGPTHGKKRSWRLEWDDYFMGVALISAQRSKDPKTQVGSCIVNADKRIVSTGYNGMPNNCNDDDMPWKKQPANEVDNKQLYVCHAEMNAIVNKLALDVGHCTIYVTLHPCNECAKVIIQSGITQVVYYQDTKSDKKETIAAKWMFEKAGVKTRQYEPKVKINNLDDAQN